jgi:hypothetical protein
LVVASATSTTGVKYGKVFDITKAPAQVSLIGGAARSGKANTVATKAAVLLTNWNPKAFTGISMY